MKITLPSFWSVCLKTLRKASTPPVASLSKRITERSALSVFGTAANSQVAEEGHAWQVHPT